MSADLAPKLTDLKNLQDLAKIFSLPMLAVAYILQTGLVVSFEGSTWLSVSWERNNFHIWFMVLLIVILKTLWMAFWGVLVHCLIGFLHASHPLTYPLSAMCLFTLGLLGLFPPDEIASRVLLISNFWFYACFVWGFFFVAMERQLGTK